MRQDHGVALPLKLLQVFGKINSSPARTAEVYTGTYHRLISRGSADLQHRGERQVGAITSIAQSVRRTAPTVAARRASHQLALHDRTKWKRKAHPGATTSTIHSHRGRQPGRRHEGKMFSLGHRPHRKPCDGARVTASESAMDRSDSFRAVSH